MAGWEGISAGGAKEFLLLQSPGPIVELQYCNPLIGSEGLTDECCGTLHDSAEYPSIVDLIKCPV